VVTLIAIDAGTCNFSDTNTFTLRVEPVPQSGIDFNPNPVPTNEPVNFVNLSANASRYKWLFGDGRSLETIRKDTVVKHLYNASETYNACLVAFNPAGCSDTACINVPITIIPGLEVPTAFSPNGDGRNDRIFVKGFGLAKINWKIYNRWGQVVFESGSPFFGWDGKYKGELQPMDSYAYTLLVLFSDGTQVSKKGDITLLR
jgi:gliding motility-associated-like protein